MALSVDRILSVLRARGIDTEQGLESSDFQEIGILAEGEEVYATSLREISREEDGEPGAVADSLAGDDRLSSLRIPVEESLSALNRAFIAGAHEAPHGQPVEPHCAWYCPIHFFGRGWGIYIRENCIISTAVDIARLIDWSSLLPPVPPSQSIIRQLLRSSFYVYYLHEHFHHKIESLGLRLLIGSGTDLYRPYKSNVYRRAFLTTGCIEESLANAESLRRLNEPRYVDRLLEPIRVGLRRYLKLSFPLQPPGYAEATNYLTEAAYRDGLYLLQSQVLDGMLIPRTPPEHWVVSPNVITSIMSISDEIYMILPSGAQPLFPRAFIDPRATVSSRDLINALTKHHGYQLVSGGKGSHVKLAKSGGQNIHIPGGRTVVSPGVVKQALSAIGGYPISRLQDLLAGRLTAAT